MTVEVKELALDININSNISSTPHDRTHTSNIICDRQLHESTSASHNNILPSSISQISNDQSDHLNVLLLSNIINFNSTYQYSEVYSENYLGKMNIFCKHCNATRRKVGYNSSYLELTVNSTSLNHYSRRL